MEQLLAADPDIRNLKRQFKKLYTGIKREYKFIKRAPKKVGKDYKDLHKELMNIKKSLKDEIEDAYRKDYFFRIHNKMMKRQLKRQLNKTVIEVEEDVEPIVEHQLKERTRLRQILCDFSKDLSTQDIISRKVRAINLIIVLASRQEFQTRTPRSPPAYKDALKDESPVPTLEAFQKPDEFPLVCKKTQYIICIGNDQLPFEQRTRTFTRVSHMMDHVEKVHLKHQPAQEKIICHHPVCKSEGLVLNNVDHFKSHVQVVHGITLREPRYVD